MVSLLNVLRESRKDESLAVDGLTALCLLLRLEPLRSQFHAHGGPSLISEDYLSQQGEACIQAR